MKFTRSLSAIVCAIALISSPLAGDDYQPLNTQAPGEEPNTPAEAAAAITVPEGFHVTLFAGEPDVRQPVAMAIDDRGRLWVAESYSYKEWQGKGEDRILIFEDTDNDGVHDSRKVFWSGAKHLSGMTIGWGGVWLCDSPNLTFIADRNRDDVPDGEPEVVLDGWTTKAGHNFFNGLTWGIDGWLYGRHGITAPSKVGIPGTPDDERIEFDCSIWRYHPVSKAFEVVCRGTTNPWGLDWNAAGDLFFTNNVNGHLWHAIPGAYYPRMGERADPFSKFVYDRIPMACDHLHHAGGTVDWTKTRDGKGVHGELGGGHSHCGGMIYLGGKWPEKYRDRMFMCNTHGRRVNVDRLDPEGPSYVARHEDDFLHANNPWFRGVQLLYGPDGDVYLSDWTDLGECHDNDGVHRTSGRIYKIIYSDPSPPMKEKLREMSNEELIALHEHDNEWYPRMARWILLERMASGKFTAEDWARIFPDHQPSEKVQASEFASRYWATNWAIHQDEYSDLNEKNAATVIATLTDHRLLRIFASELHKYAPESRWAPAEALLKQVASLPGDRQDELLQLLIYYGIKDIAASDSAKSLQLLRTAEDMNLLFTRNLSQNLAENGIFEPLVTMLAASGGEGLSDALLSGFAAGVEGRRDLVAPDGWAEVFQAYLDYPGGGDKALRIHLAFDEAASRARLVQLLDGESANDKILALGLLADLPIADLEASVLPLLDDPQFSAAAVPVLARFSKPAVAEALITSYPTLPADARAPAINALCGNKKFAARLLDALESGAIPRHAVTAYHARQIQSLKDNELKKRLATVWGKMGSSSTEKKQQIKDWQDQLTPDVLAKADFANGETRYTQLCSACHNLHGKGGVVGPELTGANRSDVYYLLENIIDPAATLPQDYRMTVITKKDSEVVTGNIVSRNEYTVTLRTLTGELTVNEKDIAKLETTDLSMMPEGLLAPLSENDVRDLIAFLQRP